MTPEELFTDLRLPHLSHGHHHCTDGFIQLKECPSCGGDNYQLGFNIAGRYFVCWRCGGLRAWPILLELGASPSQIKELLGSRDIRIAPPKPHGTFKPPTGIEPLPRPHRRYLKNRGFDPDELVRIWQIQGICLHHTLPWRIYIPVFFRKCPITWTTRAIGIGGARYVSSSPECEYAPIKGTLYGLDMAINRIVIVEGPADAWRVGPGACALFGTAFTAAQVKIISKFPIRYLLFDNEPAAQRQAHKLAGMLAGFSGETRVLECSAKDPGEMKRKDVLLLRRMTGLDR